MTTKENDGTSVREDSARVRIQSDAGVQRYGLLTFSYPSGTGSFEIDYVRIGVDGTIVETPADNIRHGGGDYAERAVHNVFAKNTSRLKV
jgi:hypothetical protein